MAHPFGSDAFSKRRAASEDKWIRDEEQAKSVLPYHLGKPFVPVSF
jgi:hypothetical protein